MTRPDSIVPGDRLFDDDDDRLSHEVVVTRCGPRVIAVSGVVDLLTVTRFRAALSPLTRSGGDVAIDLRDVRLLGSAGTGAIFDSALSLAGRGLITLHRPTATTHKVISVTGLDQLVRVSHRPPPRRTRCLARGDAAARFG